MAVGGNLSLKFTEDGIYSYNEDGLHYFDKKENKTYTHSLFNITNCGAVFN